MHVLGYFFDPYDSDLNDYSETLKIDRYQRAERIVENLRNAALTISRWRMLNMSVKVIFSEDHI
ncbi:hypothetical protein MASR1M107_16970 [Ignavibacteriales bacterium]